ncbi:MAG: dephospho-CoA kinase [Candidatus Omnitrophica bacterium]|nr:dephospho-CoA kinase [Candidatus Omnitrophota bacterium]
MILGLTGAVCSGKTSVLEIFRKSGARTLEADRVARRCLTRSDEVRQKLLKRWGPVVLGPGGRVSRARVRGIVLEEPARLEILERVLHPAVRSEVRAFASRERRRKRLGVVEVPLLFEAGMEKLVDRTLVVCAACDRRRAWAAQKGVPRKLFDLFDRRQWPVARKAKRADFVVHNNGKRSDLNKEVKAICLQLKKK